MGLTAAEKQRRYRERQKLNKAQGVLPDAPTGALPSPAPRVAADAIERLVDAGTAARASSPSTDELWAAFEAGVAARIFCEIAQGMTGAEDLLIDWLDSQPAGLWLFHQFLTERGLWGHFESWSSSRSESRAV